MKSICLKIVDELDEVLTLHAKSLGITRTECIRRAIKDYLLVNKVDLKALNQAKNDSHEDKSSMRVNIRLANKQAQALLDIAASRNVSFSQYTKEVLLKSLDKNILSEVDLEEINKLILELQKTGRLLNQAIKNHAVIPSKQQEEIINLLDEKYKEIEFKYIYLNVKHLNEL